LDLIELFRNGSRILGFRVATPEEIRSSLEMALAGTITVPLARTFAMSEAGAAHAFVDERRHVGKVVLVHE
jgi:NADPH:quinone reductase-like Zn-dependent oxidoreductase